MDRTNSYKPSFMANLKSIEKVRLEKYLAMGGGTVCDFSNRTFQEFVIESVGVDLYEDKYGEGNSGSKANRLRAFWKIESNQRVAKLLLEISDYWKSQLLTQNLFGHDAFNEDLYNECTKIIEKLKREIPIDDIDALTPNSDNKDFALLASSIKESIEKGEPGLALDRLHTFVVKYLRELCDQNGLSFDKNTALNSLIGGYVRYLHENSLIESTMTQRILKSSIGVLESFDYVRNNQSLAHDNPVLNYEESILIFNNVSNTIRFVESLEKKLAIKKTVSLPVISEDINWEDIPF